METQNLILYGWQMALIGMLAVFGFLWLLTVLIDVTSYLVRLTEKKDTSQEKIAAAIAIALHQGGK